MICHRYLDSSALFSFLNSLFSYVCRTTAIWLQLYLNIMYYYYNLIMHKYLLSLMNYFQSHRFLFVHVIVCLDLDYCDKVCMCGKYSFGKACIEYIFEHQM